jgi:protein-S-isoprenylcysteine O-methyltransferase Ste14
MFINIKSDYLIVALRKENGPGYHMPSKFMHKYISAPNYFGEIIEWIGWAILTWSISGLVFALWTIANLFPRALAHHKWYQEKFSDYPKSRKAIIPGII